MPQVAASLVAARLAAGDDEALTLTGQGLRDVTRVAASDPDLWVDVLAANADQVGRILNEFRDDVDGVIRGLQLLSADPHGGRALLRDLLVRGNAGRARLPGKHGGRAAPYVIVPVVVADRAGELARLLTDAGASGVNVEDVRIEHSPGQPVGLVELAVAPAAEAVLVAALERLGWVVHG
jgi:prephenate dehydrogenase